MNASSQTNMTKLMLEGIMKTIASIKKEIAKELAYVTYTNKEFKKEKGTLK